MWNMPNDYLTSKEYLEKHKTLENLIQFTVEGYIKWEKVEEKYIATYTNHLRNIIEYEAYNGFGINMGKIVIKNENGEVVIYNRDVPADLLNRFRNAVMNCVKDENVLQDFL